MKTFVEIEMAPPDPIFGLSAAFAEESRSEKVNLGVGIYRTADLKPPVLQAVKRAEERLMGQNRTRAYLPIDGDRAFTAALAQLLFGKKFDHGRLYAAQTPGGSGGLRVAGDLLFQELGHKHIHLPSPTWGNHRNLFAAAGLQVETYVYYDRAEHVIAFDELLGNLNKIPEGHCVLFHACCHNPTGIDPTLEQWKEIAEVVKKRKLLPLFDCAYQGFARGIEEDVAAVRHFAEAGIEMFVIYSCSKNFALYAERTGALFALTPYKDAAERVGSQVRRLVRCNYSNPPCHGAWIVQTILEDEELRRGWEGEVSAMRGRIQEMRASLMAGLLAKGGARNFAFLEKQQGLFSFCGLNRDQVERLKSDFAIYMPGTGRINVTGLNSANIDYVVEAICSVL